MKYILPDKFIQNQGWGKEGNIARGTTDPGYWVLGPVKIISWGKKFGRAKLSKSSHFWRICTTSLRFNGETKTSASQSYEILHWMRVKCNCFLVLKQCIDKYLLLRTSQNDLWSEFWLTNKPLRCGQQCSVWSINYCCQIICNQILRLLLHMFDISSQTCCTAINTKLHELSWCWVKVKVVPN